MKLDLALCDAIAGRKVNRPNATSLIKALDIHDAGLGEPQRLAHFLAQVMHESGDFRYDQEIWGPTAAQQRYDTRTDLGNTPARDGDGYANRGMGPIQLTGAANRRAFRDWAEVRGMSPPDFVGNENLLTDPWEGLSAVWYWDAGNPSGETLNRYADENDPEMITRRVNGGLNGYADRLDRYTRAGLVMLGYGPTEVVRYQEAQPGLTVDGIAGRRTRAAIHADLCLLRDAEPVELPEWQVAHDELQHRVAALEARVVVLEASMLEAGV